jgi:predicted Zn-ribbon and HTH transcriptional regulator
MQGLQKLKCTNCGTMFMSEIETADKCPTCSGQSYSHHEHADMGGCGCGH